MMGLASFSTLAQIQGTDYTFGVNALGYFYEGIPTGNAPSGYAANTWMLFILTVVGALLPLIDIFLFRNLRRQMSLAVVSMLFVVSAAAVAAVGTYGFADGATVVWTQLSCAPLIALVAEIMAWQRINSDRRKIEAADRFR